MHQLLTVAVPIEFFNRLTDAADIPTSRAVLRTPLPAASSCLALAIFVAESGGRPNLIDRLLAAA